MTISVGYPTVSDEKLTQPIKTVKDKYEVLPAFLQARGLVKQQIESFNYLVNHDIKKIVRATDNQKVTCESDPSFYLKFLDIHVGVPQIMDNFVAHDIPPQHCRLRDLTYSAEIKVDIEFTSGPNKVVSAIGKDGNGHVTIGRMPIMLRSDRCLLKGKSEAELATLGECPLDPGGYFVVKGTEKVVLIQEQLSKNRVLIDTNSQGILEASVTSSTHERRSITKISIKRGSLVLKQNSLSEDLNIAIAMKAMGIESDQEIIQYIGPEPALLPILLPTLQECKKLDIFTQQQALNFIGSKVKVARTDFGAPRRRKPPADEARELLKAMVFSHVPVIHYNFEEKALYTALVIRRLLCAMLDPKLIDDRDYYGNKRLELAGGLLGLLFEDLFKRMCTDLRKEAEKVLSKNRGVEFDISKRIRSDTITVGMESALSSGNWNIKRFRMERKGVSQVLSRLSFMASLGMMTRIQSQFEKSRKVSGPRSLQPSQWGMLCPADTPEGEACGLVKNLALMTHVTTDEEEEPLRRLSFALGVEPTSLVCNADFHRRGSAVVYLNGLILGVHRQPLRFVEIMRKIRRSGRIREYISVSAQQILIRRIANAHGGQQGCVYIACDGGRVCRPLIICDEGKPRITEEHTAKIKRKEWTFDDLLRQGFVEYLDVNEENNCLIALYERFCTPQTTHLEIEPFTLMGVVAGLIPFPHHNQSPRNTYQCAMGKQAMGNIAYNQLNRMDTLLYLLVYPQRPLLTTKTIELVGFDKLGAGQNATVAVMSFSAYDIEDAIVMNKASLDRGFGRCIFLRRYACGLRKYPNRSQDTIRAPPVQPGEVRLAFFWDTRAGGKFALLEQDGIAAVGEAIKSEDVYINKFVPTVTRAHAADGTQAGPSQIPENTFKPAPQKYKGPIGESCVVDRVLITEQDEGGGPLIKVLIRHTRRPELGDKFSSRHGQKGVVGNIVAQADMPFSERGICPDLIMNPHGFPSRMTVGKMIELLGSKAGALSGRFHYGTAFGEEAGLADNVESISKVLIEHGFSYNGKDMLTNGTTGEPLEANIFMGPVYYQKLKHMVVDKIHARSTGPRVVLTRQPTEGRGKDGGLRLGEMERDCLIGYGAAMLLLERLMISSDQFEVHVCTHCGKLGYYDAKTGQPCCPSTKQSDAMQTMKLPYACKLLFQELQSMNIVPQLRLSEA